jgi:hypothetical protein
MVLTCITRSSLFWILSLSFQIFAKKDKVPRMVPSIAQVVFVPHQRLLNEPQLPTLWLVCGALGRISTRLTCATWGCWDKDRIQEETSHATWSRCESVWNIFLFVFSKYSLLWYSPLALLLEGSLASSFFLCSLIGAHIYFFYSFWAYTFFDDTSLLLQEYKKKNILGT